VIAEADLYFVLYFMLECCSQESSIVHIFYAPDSVIAQVRELRHSNFEKISKFCISMEVNMHGQFYIRQYVTVTFHCND
jgi:hypothetical protein